MDHPFAQGWIDPDNPIPTTLLNDFYADAPRSQKQPSLSSFPLFSRLPPEIAFLIWKQALRQTRMIGIGVTAGQSEARLSDEQTADCAVEEAGCRMRLYTHHCPSPLLQTSRQSRQAALEFHRVRLPWHRTSDGEKRYLYICPEMDFLLVRSDGINESSKTLANFLSLLRASDPRDIGVLNLGILCRGFSDDLHTFLNAEQIPVHLRQKFTETISRLRYVFFHFVPKGEARILFHALGMREVVFNRAFPIHASVETFDFIESDPRPIEAYLDKAGLGRDPRSAHWIWRQMERGLGINHKVGMTRFAYHLAAPAFGPKWAGVTRKQAIEKLHEEHRLWRSHWRDDGLWGRHGYDDPDTPDSLKSAPIPAFGFWILPLDALEEIPKEEPRFWDNYTVVDLSKHRPQLALARLL